MKRTTADDYARRILRAQQLLETHLDQPLAPAALARAAAFSLHHFHRIFRGLTGESVMEHVRRLRIERAARVLRASDARILEVAFEAGYESHEAFTRAFEERFGVAPSVFRRHPSVRVSEWTARATGPVARVEVRSCPEVRVLFRRSRGSYAAVGQVWHEFLAWLARRGPEIPPLYGICHDDPEVTEEAHLRFDAAAAASGLAPDESVALATIPSGTYAVGLHVGRYERLHETYLDVIGRWLPSSGYEPAPDEPVIEHYLDDPARTEAAALRTEVRVRLAE